MMWARWLDREQGVFYIQDLTRSQRHQFDAAILNSHRRGAPNRVWYDSNKANLNADAVRYIDNLLARSG
jgi:hypothetical protein